MMKHKGLKMVLAALSGFVLVSGFCVPAFAAGMSVSTDRDQVTQGDTIPVRVSFTGSDIWYAYVQIECDPIFRGGGTFLIEAESGESTVSDIYEVYAAETGTGQIRVSGYIGTYENGQAIDSEMFGPEILQITSSSGPSASTGAGGRSAGAGADGRDENGNLINDPSGENGGREADKTTASDPGKKSAGSKNTEKSTAKAADSGRKTIGLETVKKDAGVGIWLIAAGAVILAAIAAVGILLILRRRKRQKEDRWEDPSDTEIKEKDTEDKQ